MTNYTIAEKSNFLAARARCPRAFFGVSIGNANQRGEKLASIIVWINNNFEDVTIGVSDTLSRWNITEPTGQLLSNARDIARHKGDQWLDENQNILAGFSIPFKIVRWDHWLAHPEFEKELAKFKKLYKENESFKFAVNSDLKNFLKRKGKSGLQANDLTVNNCLNFLLEEVAAYTIIFRENPRSMKLYPGGLTPHSCEILSRGTIPEAPVGIQGVPYISIYLEENHGKKLSLPYPVRLRQRVTDYSAA